MADSVDDPSHALQAEDSNVSGSNAAPMRIAKYYRGLNANAQVQNWLEIQNRAHAAMGQIMDEQDATVPGELDPPGREVYNAWMEILQERPSDDPITLDNIEARHLSIVQRRVWDEILETSNRAHSPETRTEEHSGEETVDAPDLRGFEQPVSLTSEQSTTQARPPRGGGPGGLSLRSMDEVFNRRAIYSNVPPFISERRAAAAKDMEMRTAAATGPPKTKGKKVVPKSKASQKTIAIPEREPVDAPRSEGAGPRSSSRALPSDSGSAVASEPQVKPARAERPKGHLAPDELVWQNKWWRDWQEMTKAEKDAKRNAWRERRIAKQKPDTNYEPHLVGRKAFHAHFRTRGKIPLSEMKHRKVGFTLFGQLEGPLPDEDFYNNTANFPDRLNVARRERKAKEAATATEANDVNTKISTTRMRRRGTEDSSDSEIKSAASGSISAGLEPKLPAIADSEHESDQNTDKSSSAVTSAAQTTAVPPPKNVKLRDEEEKYAKSLLRKWEKLDDKSKKTLLSAWQTKHGDEPAFKGKKAEWWLWAKSEFNKKFPETIIYDTRFKNMNTRNWNSIVKRKSANVAGEGARKSSGKESNKEEHDALAKPRKGETGGLKAVRPAQVLKRSREAVHDEMGESDEDDTLSDLIPTSREPRLRLGKKRRKTTALEEHDDDDVMSFAPGPAPARLGDQEETQLKNQASEVVASSKDPAAKVAAKKLVLKKNIPISEDSTKQTRLTVKFKGMRSANSVKARKNDIDVKPPQREAGYSNLRKRNRQEEDGSREEDLSNKSVAAPPKDISGRKRVRREQDIQRDLGDSHMIAPLPRTVGSRKAGASTTRPAKAPSPAPSHSHAPALVISGGPAEQMPQEKSGIKLILKLGSGGGAAAEASDQDPVADEDSDEMSDAI
ncbi:hypothetical protein FKW77_006088 [Venturia effusa]|uniref:Uncharacterized protein n=1 Tax=Venturia effusa TaxID=50376 RepID=A0A517L5G3_9PEZI|nr:hypothetical protein FKW77_006088 [Venturia effusa]